MTSDCEDLRSNLAAVFIRHVLSHDIAMLNELVKPDGQKHITCFIQAVLTDQKIQYKYSDILTTFISCIIFLN
jgi:hypothetical protein